MDSELIRFYKGERNKNNVTIDEVWNFSDRELEHIHNYIQWLFPIVEPDYWNRDTPKLSKEDIEEFKNNDELKKNLIKSFVVILNFWGFDIDVHGDNISINKSEEYEYKSKNWQTYMNHNFLRITRVIHCLNDLGFRDLAKQFYNIMIEIALDNPKKINANSMVYWRNAMIKNMKGEEYQK